MLYATNLAVLAALLVCAASAGTLALGPREGIILRAALGIAICAHVCLLLGIAGQLRPAPIIGAILLILAGAAYRWKTGNPACPPLPLIAIFASCFFLPFVLTQYPPLAYDETLYHLPFVQSFVRDGAIRFLPDLRFPVFPVLHEALCVPPFLLAGDTGPHLVALAQAIITTALIIEWGGRYEPRAGWLAAALYLGSPLIIHLGTVLYVDMALTLFVVAGFYALDRERYALAGIFFGSACSVKYLGFYFALVALLIVMARAANRRRSAAFYALGSAVAALPMTAWIFLNTHNPVFPFFGTSPWALSMLSPPGGLADRAMRLVRVVWDVTFARERIGSQPPVTPLLIGILLLVVAAATRNRMARWLVLMSAGYLVIFNFLPQDARYLASLLPLLCLVAAIVVAARWPKAVALLAVLAIAPGIAYGGYRIMLQGRPPSTSVEREAWLMRHLPEYRALRRGGAERIYVCGGERLKSYATGELLGDFNGLHSRDRVLKGANTTQAIAENLRRVDLRYFLVGKQLHCTPPVNDGGMEIVYEDEAAQLWRVSEPLVGR